MNDSPIKNNPGWPNHAGQLCLFVQSTQDGNRVHKCAFKFNKTALQTYYLAGLKYLGATWMTSEACGPNKKKIHLPEVM